MTKKDFALIADVIKGMPEDLRVDAAQAFALRLKLVNPLFKTDSFLKACGIPASIATGIRIIVDKE